MLEDFNPVNVSKNYTLTPPTEVTTSNPFIKLLKIIWNAVKGLFRKIAERCSPQHLQVTKNERRLMLEAKNRGRPILPSNPNKSRRGIEHIIAHPLMKSKITVVNKPSTSNTMDRLGLDPLRAGNPSKTWVEVTKQNKKPQLAEIKDPVMRDLHDTVQDFAENTLEAVFEEKIQPTLFNVKEGLGKATEVLKFGADLGLKIGDRAAKPLFEKLRKFEIGKNLNSDLEQLLMWLLKEKPDEMEFRKLLYKRLIEKKIIEKDERIDKKIEDCVNPCVHWLLNTDHKKPLIGSYSQKVRIPIDTSIIQTTAKEAVLLLLENKIDQYMKLIQEKVGGEALSKILQKTMASNGRKITGILVRRVIELLETTQYSALFDKLVSLASDQTNAVIEVEAAKAESRIEQEKLLKKARKVKNKKHKTDDDNERVTFLKEVEVYGEKKWKRHQEEKEGLKAYARNKICHEEIKKLILDPGMSKVDRTKIEKKMYTQLADGLVQLLLPKRKIKLPDVTLPSGEVKEGEVEEVDELVYLCDQIEIPSEFKELFSEATKIYDEILTQETKSVIEKLIKILGKEAYDRVQEIILDEVKKEIRGAIIKGARDLFEKVLTPEGINEMMAYGGFSSIRNNLIDSLSRGIISTEIKTFAPLFHTLASQVQPTESERNQTNERISKKLYEEVGKHCSQFKFKDNISEKGFQTIITPLVVRLEGYLRTYLNSVGKNELNDVEAALNVFFEKENHGNNTQYGDLVENVLFKIGNLSGGNGFVKWVASTKFLKELISKQITAATHEIGSSPHYLVKIISKMIRDRFSDEEKIKDLLFKEEKKRPVEETNLRLEEEKRKTAELIHDLICTNLNKMTAVPLLLRPGVKNGVKWVIGGDANTLNSVITEVYNKMLGNDKMTKNLLLRWQEVILKALLATGEDLEAKRELHPLQVSRLPSLKFMLATQLS